MIPNNQADVKQRFQKLTEAIKFVWASTFFRDAKSYMRAIKQSPENERMAVIIQEVSAAVERPLLSDAGRRYSHA